MSAADQTESEAAVVLEDGQVLIRDLVVDGAVADLVTQELAAGGDAERVVTRALELGSAVLLHGGAMGTVEAVAAQITRLVEALDDRSSRIEALGRMRSQVSSASGRAFEEEIGPVLEALAAPHADELEATGASPGIADEKVGDFVITLNPRDTGGRDRRVVVELKKRRERPSLQNALGELDRAMLNRDAQVAVMVFAGRNQAPMQGAALRHYHGNRLMVVWNPEDEPGSELALEVAMQLARTLAIASSREDLTLDRALLAERLDKLTNIIDRGKAVRRGISTARRGLDAAEDAFEVLHEEALAVVLELQDRL
jgi:hypothetical protein